MPPNRNSQRTRRARGPRQADGAVAGQAPAGEDVAEADVVVVHCGVLVQELASARRRTALAEVDALVGALVGGQDLRATSLARGGLRVSQCFLPSVS